MQWLWPEVKEAVFQSYQNHFLRPWSVTKEGVQTWVISQLEKMGLEKEMNLSSNPNTSPKLRL